MIGNVSGQAGDDLSLQTQPGLFFELLSFVEIFDLGTGGRHFAIVINGNRPSLGAGMGGVVRFER